MTNRLRRHHNLVFITMSLIFGRQAQQVWLLVNMSILVRAWGLERQKLDGRA
jgi:hypothetical protein